jgi:hypothetical protein
VVWDGKMGSRREEENDMDGGPHFVGGKDLCPHTLSLSLSELNKIKPALRLFPSFVRRRSRDRSTRRASRVAHEKHSSQAEDVRALSEIRHRHHHHSTQDTQGTQVVLG